MVLSHPKTPKPENPKTPKPLGSIRYLTYKFLNMKKPTPDLENKPLNKQFNDFMTKQVKIVDKKAKKHLNFGRSYILSGLFL